MAQQVKRAATLTAELAAQAEKKIAAVCDQPPGLGEPAWHIEAPNMGAGGSPPQATMMPDPWTTYKCPSASQTKVSNPLSASQDLSSYSRKFRGRQKRSDMRAQEAASLIDETLNFFVNTTQGKTKLRCVNNSRVRSVKSCGEVEITGKHAPKMKSVSKR